MATATMTPAHSSTAGRARDLLETYRWAPAPRFEGDASSRSRYVGYLVASLLGWTAIGLGITAALGGLLNLIG